MSTKETFETIDRDQLVTATGGSEAGDVCRDTYTAAGGAIGGAATSESGGWGAIPGAVIGGWLGRRVCPK